jgi:GMP synthase-like glutamine amidotransferase
VLLDALLERGLAPVVRGVSRAGELPDVGAAPAAILIGSQSAKEATTAGLLDADVDWVRRADAAGVTILGIGHGARALARAFGGSLSPAERPLRGWSLVDTAVPHLISAGPWR